MNPAEYDRMAELETDHWWYRGVRDLLSHILRLPRFAPQSGANLLDAGCGCGENLRHLSTILQHGYRGGFDIAPVAVAHAFAKNPNADVYVSDLCEPDIHAESLDVILCCDVLYTTPLEPALRGLKRLCDRLRPGGLLLLHLPAYNWLTSRHDRVVHTRQRFTIRDARRIVADLGLKLELATYRMFFLFPAVVLSRLPSMLVPAAGHPNSASDVKPTFAPLNRALFSILKLESLLIDRGLRFPWGSSILAVGRKA